MLPRKILTAAALSAATFLAAPSALAFTCAVPGLFSAAKKTVCGNPTLAALDQAEDDGFKGLRDKLGAEAMAAIGRDRRTFLKQRNACAREVRCHEATYTAQTRLYARLGACSDRGNRKMFCVTRTILKHREELHRSM
jgi:uncharacterized protein